MSVDDRLRSAESVVSVDRRKGSRVTTYLVDMSDVVIIDLNSGASIHYSFHSISGFK